MLIVITVPGKVLGILLLLGYNHMYTYLGVGPEFSRTHFNADLHKLVLLILYTQQTFFWHL